MSSSKRQAIESFADMNLIKFAIDRPTAVVAAVIMAVLFGLVALKTIPIQLAPDVARPVIDIQTNWLGAAPAEVEREILNLQEEQLKGLSGLERIEGRALQSQARLKLEFAVGTDMDKALLLVSNRLDGVSGYPDEADEPRLKIAGPEDNRIAWFHLTRQPANAKPIHHYGDFANNVIRDRLERVPGVATVNFYGGGAREIRITVDPGKMARYQLTVPEVITLLRRANVAVTGGDVEEGKRRYVVRMEAELNTADTIKAVVLRTEESRVLGSGGGIGRVLVGDIARVEYGYKKPTARVRTNGEPAIAINATRQVGANVIETMKGIRRAVGELNAGPVAQEQLVFRQLYDETVYIDSAIELVVQNIWIGGTIAVAILLLFLKSLRATLVVGLAIPVSVIASFVAMALLGRSINVVSLAGIAFAIGMVVDAAIVVLENIYRMREQGKHPSVAALVGTKQVWGAILVSALTTVMVFIPLLIMDLEVGQLFRDIAVAISVSVLLSLIVSVTVIPALSMRLLSAKIKKPGAGTSLPVIDHFARGFIAIVVKLTRRIVGNRGVAFCIVGGLTAGTLGMTWWLLPPLEYLPEGNRNLVISVVQPPAGYNLKTMSELANRVEAEILPRVARNDYDIPAAHLPPKLKYFIFVVWRQQVFFLGRGIDPTRVKDVIPLLEAPVFKEPSTFVHSFQPSIFGRGIGGSRSIDMDITGLALKEIFEAASLAGAKIGAILPRKEGTSFRPRPSLQLGEPEIRVVPDRVRLADAGLSAQDLAVTVDTFNDGVRVVEVTEGGQQIDLMLMGPEDGIEETQGIAALPVVTPAGTILPVSSLADVQVTAGPTEIRHVDSSRTVTLQIRPAPELALGDALDILQRDVIDKLFEEGLPPDIRIRLSGTADKLIATAAEMKWDLAIALAIVYLVMAVLFESFVYPLIIVLSVPLATAGGVIGLNILNLFHFQALDMLTLLGFVILIGIVVNNAILLVHQTLYHIREEGLVHADAIVEATRNRIRPIFMSTLTSVGGMLPLVVFPGAGSEIYRGLGSVVVGGLSLSAVLTLAIVPPLLSVFIDVLERKRGERTAAVE
ncbi:MAG: efflux RND transporter permease subunit [Pseudomonadota bacterium]|nr:efflux RND transporter permease subunit [Pseudomonadota bacterium]